MTLFRSFWAIYGILLFLTMTAVTIPILLLNMAVTPGTLALRRNIRFMHHVFAKIFLLLVGIRLRIHGKEHIINGHSYVIVANHTSSVDFIINGAAFPGIFRFLAKQDLLKIPLFGFVVRKMCLIVDRKSAMSRARSVVALKQELSEGVSVLIYPEGSRNKTTDALGKFYDGAFRIAIQTKASILPFTIANIRQVSDASRGLDLCPGVVDIYVETPITTDLFNADDTAMLSERVRTQMMERVVRS